MVLDYQSINKHLEILREYVADLIAYRREFTKERFMSDRKAQHLTLYAFQMAIQSCLDIGNRIVADLSLRRPEENVEIFLVLADKGVIPKDFSSSLVRMVRFRNMLVHIYWKIDLEEVWLILQERPEDFNRFEEYIMNFLQNGK